MGIIKCTGYVPGYGYVADSDFVRNMTAVPKTNSKEVLFERNNKRVFLVDKISEKDQEKLARAELAKKEKKAELAKMH